MQNLSSFDMTSQKIVNVLDPTAAQDAATKNYVDTHTSGTLVSDGATSPAVVFDDLTKDFVYVG